MPFRQKVYRFRSRGIYLSIDRYIRFIRKVYTFFYVMYTECDEENMNFGSSVDKKDIGSGYFLLLQPIIALPQWASAHNE